MTIHAVTIWTDEGMGVIPWTSTLVVTRSWSGPWQLGGAYNNCSILLPVREGKRYDFSGERKRMPLRHNWKAAISKAWLCSSSDRRPVFCLPSPFLISQKTVLPPAVWKGHIIYIPVSSYSTFAKIWMPWMNMHAGSLCRGFVLFCITVNSLSFLWGWFCLFESNYAQFPLWNFI